MNTRRKRLRSALALLLAAAIAMPFFAPQAAAATAADDQEYELLGSLASLYEGGNAGAISNNAGDIGGKSYGAYQLASASGGPMTFAKWCMESENEY